MRQKKSLQSDNTENIFWITMSDLLLGLMIVFLVLFVMVITGYSQMIVEQQRVKADVAKELSKLLNSQQIDAQVDMMTGKVKISDLELFELSSWELSPKGKAYLNKFIPIYIETIFSNPKLTDRVSGIVIEGHTDSHTFAGVKSKDEQFILNMDLSTKRANAVAAYIFKTNYNKKYSDELRKILTVEGKSYTEPVLTNGKEDYAKSRRVELQLNVTDKSVSDYLKITK